VCGYGISIPSERTGNERANTIHADHGRVRGNRNGFRAIRSRRKDSVVRKPLFQTQYDNSTPDVDSEPLVTHRIFGLPVLSVVRNTGIPARHRDPIRRLKDWWLS
jgi:hypothetical protein